MRKIFVKEIWIFLFLLTLPILRFGVWDYGNSEYMFFVYLVMIITYYHGKYGNRKIYYIFSVIGIFTKEVCLYVNIFLVIDAVIQNNEEIKEILKPSSLKNKFFYILQHNRFELLLALILFVWRFIITNLYQLNMIEFGMISKDVLLFHFQQPKILFSYFLIFGSLWIVIFKENALKINILIFFVIVFTIFFGFLWEIDKLGCLFIIIIAESKSLKEDLNLEDLKEITE